jgi:lipopolysaccharide transport system ATP-binding protein
MPNPIIEVQNLSKLYQLGTIGGRTLRESLQRRWYRLRGKEDLLRRVGTDHRKSPLHPGQAGPRPNTMWALKDVSFAVQEGETLGIIGRNGAGKSTLLKLLARITEPTSGRAVIHGRVASLLEVGTGFHPELTGRENVYLSGATLGMKKSEISRKFEEIVAFSDIGAYLDTPVKRYSSGMYVRLAFAVAAHLEPEVLIVDEVLAVGDAAFQKKCLGKMDDAAKGGRTVLFVSHNMAAIRQLCQKCAVFEEGRLQELAPAGEVVDRYLKQTCECSATSERCFDLDTNKEFQVRSARLLDQKGTPKADFSCDEPVVVEMICQVHRRIPGLYGYLRLDRPDGTRVIVSDSFDVPPNSLDELGVGAYSLLIRIPPRSLAAGDYTVYVNFTSSAGIRGFDVDSPGRILSFRLDDHLSRRGSRREGYFSTLLPWEVARVPDELTVQSLQPTGDVIMRRIP